MITPEGAERLAREEMNQYWIHQDVYRICFVKEPDARDKNYTIYFVAVNTEKRILAIVQPNGKTSLVLY